MRLKRWICAVVSCAVVALGWWSLSFTQGVSRSLLGLLEQSRLAVLQEDWEEAAAQAEILHEDWDRSVHLLQLILPHSLCDRVEFQLAATQTSIGSQAKVDALRYAAVLELALRHLPVNEIPTWQNVM